MLLSHFPGLFYFMKRDSVIFYRSFYESIQTLNLEIQAQVYNAIFEYSLNHVEPDLTGVPLGFFTLIKPQLDANHQRFINGNKQKNKRGGSETEAKSKQKESERQANANVNANVNVNVNDNEKGNTGRFTPPSENEVHDYFISKLNTTEAEKEYRAFFSYYESNGWKVGKNKMKNWHAAAAGWISRMSNFKTENNGQTKLGTSAARMEALKNW